MNHQTIAGLHESQLATITPLDPNRVGRVISLFSSLKHTGLMMFAHAGYLIPLFVSFKFLSIDGTARPLGILVLSFSLLWLTAVIILTFVYPEWPINLLLCRKLRRVVDLQASPQLSPFDEDVRVVELVPRDRWTGMYLDSATDLMLLRVDERGAWMKGDHFSYELPRGSILDAQHESIRPSGWFCVLHIAVITVRTADGPVELPISYRDHHWGNLRWSRRRDGVLDLIERINRVACGQQHDPCTVPSTKLSKNRVYSDNPYATPSL